VDNPSYRFANSQSITTPAQILPAVKEIQLSMQDEDEMVELTRDLFPLRRPARLPSRIDAEQSSQVLALAASLSTNRKSTDCWKP